VVVLGDFVADALAISDCGFGVVTPEEVRSAARSAKREIPVTLNSRCQLNSYKNAGITPASPNEAEMEALHHASTGSSLKELERCGDSTREELKLKSLLVTAAAMAWRFSRLERSRCTLRFTEVFMPWTSPERETPFLRRTP
jgi:bifunctional ADP-heptose synthase (sugar kinase/adenylyltransferase)